MTLTKAAIADLLPHSGKMLLIDRVDAWNEHSIRCSTDSHHKPDHPLRRNGRLSALHLIEYGAQTMGIHGGLLYGGPQPGYLAAIRDARFMIDDLDDVNGSLHIEATALGKTAQGALYEFTIRGEQGRLLLSARATVVHS